MIGEAHAVCRINWADRRQSFNLQEQKKILKLKKWNWNDGEQIVMYVIEQKSILKRVSRIYQTIEVISRSSLEISSSWSLSMNCFLLGKTVINLSTQELKCIQMSFNLGWAIEDDPCSFSESQKSI